MRSGRREDLTPSPERVVPAGEPAGGDSLPALGTTLITALEAAGYRTRLAPVGVAAGLAGIVRSLRDQGLLTSELYERYASHFAFTSPPEVARPRTVIVAAWRSPAVKVLFHLETGPLEAVIPPTYVSSEGRARCLALLRSVLEPAGYSVGRAAGPAKLLAVKTGLAQYGRNNLAYVTGMGSYVRLEAFCTDADLGAVQYVTKGSELMSCCPPCRNCHHVCPTGCIPHDGTVIDASRCLTYLNEEEGDWPDWLPPTAHNSLVGCMRCQEMCPDNRYYPRSKKLVAVFDRRETDAVLRDLPPDRLPVALRAKLEALDLVEYSPVLGRNLRALREAARRAHPF
jgi:epoxyqueuosine reductase